MTDDSGLASESTASRASTVRRSLLVPMGGTGWVWGFIARYGLLFSIGFFLWALPIRQPGAYWSAVDQKLYELFDIVARHPKDQYAAHVVYDWTMPLVLALIWMLVERKRKFEPYIHEIAHLAARYGMAVTLASYGIEKIMGGQGSWSYEPQYLLAGFGEQGGGQTLMTWLGHSTVYEQFAGWVEVSCTLLLPFRRTATLGAIMSLAALINVYVVNTGHWDLGLSLTPVAFGAMPLILLAPEAKRLTRFFFGLPADQVERAYLTPPRWYWPVATLTKIVTISWMLYQANHFFFAAEEHAWHSPLGGLYRVESFTRNGKVEPLDDRHPLRWREVAIGRAGEDLSVANVDGSRHHFGTMIAKSPPGEQFGGVALGGEQAKITAAPEGDLPLQGHYGRQLEQKRVEEYARQSGSLHYKRVDPDEVTLKGIYLGDTVDATLRRIPLDTMPFYRYRWYPTEWRRRIGAWARARGAIYPY